MYSMVIAADRSTTRLRERLWKEPPDRRSPARSGIRFDFNHGARVSCRTGPRASGGSGCATSTPATSCSRSENQGAFVSSSKR